MIQTLFCKGHFNTSAFPLIPVKWPFLFLSLYFLFLFICTWLSFQIFIVCSVLCPPFPINLTFTFNPWPWTLGCTFVLCIFFIFVSKAHDKITVHPWNFLLAEHWRNKSFILEETNPLFWPKMCWVYLVDFLLPVFLHTSLVQWVFLPILTFISSLIDS